MRRRVVARRNVSVPYLDREVIEKEAEFLLIEFREKYPDVPPVPVPIDGIVENFLKLTFEFRDLQQDFGLPDVHGALWVPDRRVAVDTSLDPETYPEKEGRCRFTLGHEAGHWRLHRQFLYDPAQPMLGGEEASPSVVCRASMKREPIEQQADRFSAALLMPRALVRQAWHEVTGDDDPVILEEVVRSLGPQGSEVQAAWEVEQKYTAPMASRFRVSRPAMKIRLVELELICQKAVPRLF